MTAIILPTNIKIMSTFKIMKLKSNLKCREKHFSRF